MPTKTGSQEKAGSFRESAFYRTLLRVGEKIPGLTIRRDDTNRSSPVQISDIQQLTRHGSSHSRYKRWSEMDTGEKVAILAMAGSAVVVGGTVYLKALISSIGSH